MSTSDGTQQPHDDAGPTSPWARPTTPAPAPAADDAAASRATGDQATDALGKGDRAASAGGAPAAVADPRERERTHQAPGNASEVTAEPTSVINAEPTAVIASEPASVINAEPTAVIASEPASVINAEPTMVDPLGTRTQQAGAVGGAEPGAGSPFVVQTGPGATTPETSGASSQPASSQPVPPQGGPYATVSSQAAPTAGPVGFPPPQGAAAPAAPVQQAAQAPAAGTPGAPAARPGRDLGSLLARVKGPLFGSLAGLGVTYLGAVVLMLLLLAGMALQPSVRSSVGSATDQIGAPNPFSAAGSFLGMTCQVVGMAFLGALHGSVSIFSTSLAASMRFPLLSVLFLAIAAIYLGTRFFVRRSPVAGRTAAALPAALSGLVFALLVLLITRLAALGQGQVTIHAATAGLFFFAWLVAGVTSYLGITHASRRAALGDHPVAREVGRAFGVAAWHLGTFSLLLLVLGGIIGFIAVAVQDGFGRAVGALLILPICAGNLLFAVFGQATGASLTSSTPQSGVNVSQSASLFGYPAAMVVLVLLCALVALAVAASRWATVRRVGRVNPRAEAVSWAVLPLTYLALGLFMLIDHLQVNASTGIVGAVSVGAGLAWWTPIVMALLGLVVELLARYLGPVLVRYLDPVLSRLVPARFARRSAPAPVAAGAAGTVAAPAGAAAAGPLGVAGPLGAAALLGATSARHNPPAANGPVVQPATADAALSGPAAAGPGATAVTPAASDAGWEQPSAAPQAEATREPMDPRTRKRLLVVAGILAAVLALVLVLVAVVHQLQKSVGPDREARQVLDAIVAGDADKAARLTDASGDRTLLTSAIYGKATDRVTSYSIGSVTESGDTARVNADLTIGSRSYPVQITEHRAGRKYGLVNTWKVSALPTSKLYVSAPANTQKVVVNGTDVTLPSSAVNTQQPMLELDALPGTYQVSLPSVSKYLTSNTISATAVPQGFSSGDTTLKYEASPALTDEVNTQVKQAIDTCAKATTPDPAGCPFNGYAPTGYKDFSWKVLSYPTVTLSENSEPMTWYVNNGDTYGNAEYSYRYDSSYGFGAAKWEATKQQTSYYVSGTVSVDGDKVTVQLR